MNGEIVRPGEGSPTVVPFESFRFSGDHNAVEDWAAAFVGEYTGLTPAMSVFEGDCCGIYINPRRLDELGIVSRYAVPVLIRTGEAVVWTGTEFIAQGGVA